MAKAQNDPPSELDAKLALLDGKLEALSDLAQAVAGMRQMVGEATWRVTENSSVFCERLLPLVEQVTAEQAQLRALILRKTENLQDTMDLVRQDARNAWNSADFTITKYAKNWRRCWL